MNTSANLYAHCQERYSSGRTKWFPHGISDEEVARGRKFVQSFCTNQRTQERLSDLSQLFLSINTSRTADELIHGLVGQWLQAGLAPGTMETYWNIVKFYLPKAACKHTAKKAIQRYHAIADTKHALDVSFELAIRIVNTMIDKRWSLAASVAEIVLRTGLRVSDVGWLTAASFTFSRGFVTITVRITKNRQKRSDRTSATIPLWFGEFSMATRRFIASSQPGTLLFKNADVNAVNLVLKRSPCPKATSYSLRRAFIRRALEEVKYDVELAAKRYTLHHRAQTLLAHYVPEAEATTLGLVKNRIAAIKDNRK